MKIRLLYLSLLTCLFTHSAVWCQPVKWALASHEIVLSPSIYDGYAYNTGAASDIFGNLFITGNYEECNFYIGTVALSGDPTSANAFVVKIDSAGNVKWGIGTKGGSTEETRVATDVSGNVLVCGAFYSDTLILGSDRIPFNFRGYNNYFLTKLDSQGNALWSKGGSGLGFNSNGNYDVKTDAAGNVYFLGSFGVQKIAFGADTLVNFAPTYASVIAGDTSYSTDVFLVKFDPAGNVVWVRSAGGTGSDDAHVLTVDDAGNAYISGIYSSNPMQVGPYSLPQYSSLPGQSMFVAKYRPDGTVAWAKGIGSTSGCNPNALLADPYGNAYMTGYFNASITMGTTLTVHTPSHQSGFLVKFDSSGNYAWAQKIGDTTSATGMSLAYGRLTHHVYLSGTFGAPEALTIGSLTISQADTNSWGATAFIAEYNDTGSALCNVSADLPYGMPFVSLDAHENILMSGTFYSNLYFQPSYHFANTSNNSVFAAMYPNCGPVPVNNAVKQVSNSGNISIYPNPASGGFTIEYGIQPDMHSTATLCDLAGRQLLTTPLLNNSTKVSTTSLAPGIYLCNILLNGTQLIKKVVIE